MEIVAGSYEDTVIGLCPNEKSEEYELTETFTEKTNGSIRCVAVSDKGLLATGGTDEIIRIFSLKKRRLVGSLTHHSGTVTSLQFHQTHLFSTSEDGTLCLWRVATWEAERTFRGHKGPVKCVAVHPSGKLTLTVSQDKTLRLWNNITGRIAYISNLKEPADLVSWSPGGLYYVVSYSTKIEVFSVESRGLHSSITTTQKVNSILFISDTVVAYGGEGKIRNGEREKAKLFFTDVLEGHCLWQTETTCDRIRDMAVRDNYLTLVGSDGTVSLYQFTTPSQGSIKVDLMASRTISLRLTSVALYSPNQTSAEKTGAPEETTTETTAKPGKTKKRRKKRKADADGEPDGVLEKRVSEENGSVASPVAKKRKVKIAEPEPNPQTKKKKKKKTKKLKAPM